MVSKLKGLFETGDNRFKLIALVAFCTIVLDQLTKWFIMVTIPLHSSVTVISGFFDIVHVQNRGAAFGFLNREDINWQFWLFFAAIIGALCLIYSISKAAGYNKKLFLLFGLIVGGALGNFIDRLFFQHVTDFLDFYIGGLHWPAFNVADIAICVGALLASILLWSTPLMYKAKDKEISNKEPKPLS